MSLKIFNYQFGSSHFTVANTYNNLGVICEA